jgi:hypothetical protein
MDRDTTTKELKTEIPNSPFDDSEWDVEYDESKGFNDEDEELTDDELNDLINYQFDDLKWNSEKKFDELMKLGHPHTQRGFYCYVISQMDDEQLQPYVDQYVGWLERMNYKTELGKLPDEVKQDEYVMDLKKRQIDDEGKRLGNQVIDDLMSLLRHKEEHITEDINDDSIRKSLHHKRKHHQGCGLLKMVGIPHLVSIGKWDDLYDWEKKWFKKYVGIRWDSKGNHIKKIDSKRKKQNIKEYLKIRHR